MNYYFFRDTDNESNLLEGKTYHAAGYVEKLYCEIGKPNRSGKDLSVSFFEPFQGIIISTWRSLDEVELFEVDEWEYKQLIESYDVINATPHAGMVYESKKYMETWIKIDELRPIVDLLNSEKITYGKAVELITEHCRNRVELSEFSQYDVSRKTCEHLHQKWEGEYPYNCKKVCQVCREVLVN